MNKLGEDTLGPLECETNILYRKCKIRITLNTGEGVEEGRVREMERNHNSFGGSEEK